MFPICQCERFFRVGLAGSTLRPACSNRLVQVGPFRVNSHRADRFHERNDPRGSSLRPGSKYLFGTTPSLSRQVGEGFLTSESVSLKSREFSMILPTHGAEERNPNFMSIFMVLPRFQLPRFFGLLNGRSESDDRLPPSRQVA
jgi:hypothetical protein